MSADALSRLERWCAEEPQLRTAQVRLHALLDDLNPYYYVTARRARAAGSGSSTSPQDAVTAAIDEITRATTTAGVEPSARARPRKR